MSQTTVMVQVNSLGLGGTQLNALDFATAVEPHGFRSVLFGPRDTLPRTGPSLLDVAAGRGLTVTAYDRPTRVLGGGAQHLTVTAARAGADIVHVYGAAADPRMTYWGPCRWGRRAFVHTIYEMSTPDDAYRHTSLVIGTGYQRDELAGRPGPTTLISPPVDLEQDAPDPAAARRFREGLGPLGSRLLVVMVCRLDHAMKAVPVEVAVRAMALLGDVGATLLVVGSGKEAARLGALGDRVCAAAGAPLVHFAGAMADPSPAYAAADVGVGMGGSAARALAFGSPLVVLGEQGLAEPFTPASASDLFRRSFWSPEHHHDAAQLLADHLRVLVSDPAARVRLGEFGRQFALRSYGLPAMASRLAEVYRASLEGYGRLAWSRDLPRELAPLTDSVRRRLRPAAGGRTRTPIPQTR